MTDYWLLNSGHSETPEAAVFSTTFIDDIAPLDEQFGIHPKRDWPQKLDSLFSTDKDQNLFVLLDAAQDDRLTDLLAGSGLQHACLYQGHALERMGRAAPWLVQLRPGNTFARLLFTAGRSPRSLWDRVNGLYLRSGADFAGLRRHLRKLMLLHDAAGKAYYLRFWDAGFIAELAQNTAHATDILHRMVKGRDVAITALAQRIDSNRFAILTPEQRVAEIAPQASYDLPLVLPTVRLSARTSAIKAISEGLWDAMPRRFSALGASLEDLQDAVRQMLPGAASFGIHGRAAIGKLVATSAFTGHRPLHDPRFFHLRDQWLPVRPPRSDLASVMRIVEGIRHWRQLTHRDGDDAAKILAVAQMPDRPLVAAPSGLAPAARMQWQDILSSEARRAGLVNPDSIAAHAAIAAICGPFFLQDPLQKRLAAIFASPADIRTKLAAEAGCRAAEYAQHAA